MDQGLPCDRVIEGADLPAQVGGGSVECFLWQVSLCRLELYVGKVATV